MFRLFFTLILSSSLAIRLPRLPSRLEGNQRLCGDLKDCESCLHSAECFATFQPGFRCMQYPIAQESMRNGSVIVDTIDCCPRAINFKHEDCGFPSTQPTFSAMHYVVFASLAITGIFMLVAVVITAVIVSRRQKTLQISSPVNTLGSSATVPQQAIELPSTSKSSKTSETRNTSPFQTDKTLAQLLQEEVKKKGGVNWEQRRNTLRNHPFDQTTIT